MNKEKELNLFCLLIEFLIYLKIDFNDLSDYSVSDLLDELCQDYLR